MRYFLLLIGVSTFLVGCGQADTIETNMSEKVPEFEYTSQNNESFSLDDLKGDWWIADFIFTNCTSVCLPMTQNMSKLQLMMKEKSIDAQIVSFSVDPDFDSPEVLKDYGNSYGISFDNWTFLTGYDFETIRKFSIKHFKNLVQAPLEGDNQVTHGTSFFLVNPEGEVIKNYDGVNPAGIEAIIDDLKKVQ